MKNLSLLISSCKKYNDLWSPHVELLEKNWPNRDIHTLLVSDGDSNIMFDRVQILCCGEEPSVPKRLLRAIECIKTDYILLTLDDYFLTEMINDADIENALKTMDELDLDYLRLYKYPHERKRINNFKGYKWIKYNDNYKVNLYPGIWKKTFLLYTLNTEKNIWEYEAALTKMAIDYGAKSAVCNKRVFPFMDVMRQGYILHGANKYLKKNNYHLEHEVIPWRKEIKRNIKFYAKEILPRFITKTVKKIMIKRGHKYYSEINVEDNK